MTQSLIAKPPAGSAAAEMSASAAPAKYRRASRVLAWSIVAIAALVLVGWAFNLESVKRVLPGCGAMNPMTATCFALLGVALLLRQNPTFRNDVAACAAVIICIAIASIHLWGKLRGGNLNIDQLLFSEQVRDTAIGPNGMAPLTAACFIFSGLSLLLIDWRTHAGAWPAQIFAGGTLFLTVLALIDVVYDIGLSSPVRPEGLMAVHTAFAFGLLFAGTLCARPDRGIIATLGSVTNEGRTMRRLLIAVLATPPLIGGLNLIGARTGLFDPAFGLTLMVTCMMAVLVLALSLAFASLQRFTLHRSQTGEMIRDEEQRLRCVVETSPDGIVVINTRGIIEFVNPALERLFGYSAGEMLGRNITMFMPTPDSERHDDYIATYLRTGESRVIGVGREVIARRKDGSTFPVYLSLGEFEINGERKFTGMLQNITYRVRAESELRHTVLELTRSNMDLEAFAYAASHDLRSPLQAIRNLAAWIEDDDGDKLSAENRDRLQLLQGRTQRLERLIDDLLQYSRAGRTFEQARQVNVNELIDEVIKSVNPPAGLIVIRVSDMPTFETVEAPLRQVFCALIGNAVKHHNKPTGRIEVAVLDSGDVYEFSVCDDGPGIAPEFHQKIFRLFETLQPRDDVEGSGMGLAVARRTVETLGGEITIDSDVGRHTIFRFTWPKTIPVRTAQRRTDPVLDESAPPAPVAV